MSPPQLGELVGTVNEMAEQRVVHLLEQTSFDGVRDAMFNVLGGFNERGAASLEVANELLRYAFSIERSTLRAGGGVALSFEAADRGEIEIEQVPAMIIDYLAPAFKNLLHGYGSMPARFS